MIENMTEALNNSTWLTLAAATARALRNSFEQTDIDGVCDREPGKVHEGAKEGDAENVDCTLNKRMQIAPRS